jgi:hypothetical protein
VIRHTPTYTPIRRVIMIAKAPVPIAIPRLHNSYIVVARAIRGTMETVYSCGVAVVVVYHIVEIIVFRIIAVGIYFCIIYIGIGSIVGSHHALWMLYAIHIVGIYIGRCCRYKYCTRIYEYCLYCKYGCRN